MGGIILEKFSDRQLGSWSVAAVAAPALYLAPAAGITGTVAALLLAAAAAMGLRVLRSGCPDGVLTVLGTTPWGRTVLLLEAAGLCVVLACLAAWSDSAFPQIDGAWLYPLILLALAAAAVLRGPAVPVRVGAILTPLLAITGGIVIAFAARNSKPQLLRPVPAGWETLGVLGALLLPLCGVFLDARVRRTNARGVGWAVLTGALTLGAAMVAVGNLGPALCAELPFPLYTVTQSLRLFGAMERFEAALSAVIVAGFFAALMLVLSAAAEILRRCIRFSSPAILISVVSYGILFWVRADAARIFRITAPIFCGLMPILLLLVANRKKHEKS